MNKQDTKKIIDRLLNKPSRSFEEFHQKTIISENQKSSEKGDIPVSWKTIFYKSYPRLPQIYLPQHQVLESAFNSVLEHRTSSRTFGTKVLSIEDLSTFLHFTFGIKDIKKGNRFYPSAGARYPIEAYILSLNTDLPKGVYHYNLKSHSLELLTPLTNLKINKYFADPKLISGAGCVILLSAVFNRLVAKYGDRGYRHVLTEIGCIMQLSYLVANSLSMNICAVGGYKDDTLNALLDIDGTQEAITGALIIGQRK